MNACKRAGCVRRRPSARQLAGWSGVVRFCSVVAACSGEAPARLDADAAVDAASEGDAAAVPVDATPVDAASVDAAPVDAAPFDGTAKSPSGDAGDDVPADAPAADAGPEAGPDVPVAYPRPDYQSIGETGLYAELASKTLAAAPAAFAPTHVLWSDGAHKRRWIQLPPGTLVDSSDMDHWQFPIGTKLWKEFASPEGVLLETRLIERYGPGTEDYWMGSFVWTADQSDARFAIDGQNDINGTRHDAPAQKLCGACHRGDAGRVLGFSAIQLSRPQRDASDVTLTTLAASGLLSAPPPASIDFPVPGDADTAAALGYLHANCGHCHNLNGTSWPDTQMVLRLRVSERDPAQSELVKTVVGGKLQAWRDPAFTTRVVPGHPELSAVLARMSRRGSRDQMPPLATELVDPTGIDLVTRWVASLPTPAP
jgi:hypothetical protein